MRRISSGLLLAVAALSAGSSLASAADDPAPPDAPAVEVQIPFANNNIWNWQVIDDKTVLIQDQSRRWYKATLFGNCINLSFANKIGFDASPGGTFDKFSALRVQGQRCPLSSLVKTDPPAKKSKVHKPIVAPTPQ
jgi:Family of unknown function (DUF6491)